jgi:hypothetical protein
VKLPRKLGQKKDKFQDFLKQHCKVRHYMFSVKKCNTSSCVCKPPRLPGPVYDSIYHLPDPIPRTDGDHYKDFDDLYGKEETTEKHRPSLKESGKRSLGSPSFLQHSLPKMLASSFSAMSVRNGDSYTVRTF